MIVVELIVRDIVSVVLMNFSMRKVRRVVLMRKLSFLMCCEGSRVVMLVLSSVRVV